MANYYAQKLNAEKMMQVYQTDIPRVARYLQAEIDYIAHHLDGGQTVLELGAGYGRVLKALAPHAKELVGVDISQGSVALGGDYLRETPNARLICADVHQFEPDTPYDVVLCVQNGLSALKGHAPDTVRRALSMVKAGGLAMFSSYSPGFWAYRLAWFQEQADKGLLGELDFERSIHGQIVCRDGFMSTTHTAEELTRFARQFDHPFHIEEVDRSSVFLVITKN